jgi:hypothetical protein
VECECYVLVQYQSVLTPCGSPQNFFDGGPLSLSDLTRSSVQSLLRILHIEVEVTKRLSDLLVLTPVSLLGE